MLNIACANERMVLEDQTVVLLRDDCLFLASYVTDFDVFAVVIFILVTFLFFVFCSIFLLCLR